VLTWSQPADIIYGTALSGAQLNASANVAGTFHYTPDAGTVLPAGTHTLSVTFTPTATLRYEIASGTVTLTVRKTSLTIRADDKTKVAGQPNPPLTAAYSGFVNGDTASSLSPQVSLTTTATTGSPAGTYPIVASGAGSANYTISYMNGTLTVTAPTLTALAIQPTSQSILRGESHQFTATATYSDGSTANVTRSATWTSANATIATVNNTGLATGVGIGTTTVTASLSGQSASASLTVTAPTLTGLTIQPANASVLAGQTRQFTATALYADGSTVNVTRLATWTSADPTVATVNNTGLATGIAAGTTTVTVSFDGRNASSPLVVIRDTGTAGTQMFSNRDSIQIPDNGPAAVSSIPVSGMAGPVTKVAVILNGITHSRPADLDILLVGPGGASVLLMSDAGGNEDLERTTIMLDDNAGRSLPFKKIKSGTYRPTNYGNDDVFPAEASAGPYAATLSAFNGTNANGTWRLYLVDDESQTAGSISSGWSLVISTGP
jgi:uncharacterized protein YjdB